MRFKKLLAVCFLSFVFLSAGKVTFAQSVSPSDSEIPSPQQADAAAVQPPEQEIQSEDLPEARSELQSVISKPDITTANVPSATKQGGGEEISPSDKPADDNPADDDTPENALKILRQPEDRIFVPGVNIAFSLQAQGTGLQYQWYYKKRGETSFSPWKNRTHSGEAVAPGESWDGIELYCEVTDAYGNTVRSDTVMACMDDTKQILAVGDSICYGVRNGNRGFVGDLGLPYFNAGLSSSALAAGVNEKTEIPALLENVVDFVPDIVIAEGGANDYCFNAPLGDIPTTPLSSTSELSDKALGTTMGGLQKLILTMGEKYPNAQRYFLFTHKTTQRQGKTVDGKPVFGDNDRYVDWTVKPNKQGYTQQDLHDAIVGCCQLYGVEVIDIYEDSPLNTADLSFCSEVSYSSDHSVTDTAYVDIDGIHPLNLGYQTYYLPEILKHIDVTQPVKELSFVEQPVGQTVSLGEALTLSLRAQGDFVKYQWYFRKEGQSDFREWTNRVCPTETVIPSASWDGIQLYCVVTDRRGSSVQSDIITVTVEQPLAILQQPENRTATYGDSITLSVKAEGIGLKYQWYYKKKGQTDFSPWNNRTRSSETVTPNASWNGIQLYCQITDKRGNSVDSDIVTVTFDNTIVILRQPESQTVRLGGPVTLSVQAEGIGLKYQWYYKKEGQDSFSSYRTGATETVTPNATWDGIQLYCRITDSFGNSVQSDVITVAVEQELAILQQPVNSSVTLGDSLTLSLKAQGIGISYQWYYKKEGQTDFSPWKNRTHSSETVTPPESWNGIQLFCRVTDKRGSYIDSDIVTVTVEQELAITRQPVSTAVTLGDSLILSVEAQGIGLHYQWYYKKKGQKQYSIWKNHTGASESVTPNATWNGIQLYCKITDKYGNTVNSDTITVKLK